MAADQKGITVTAVEVTNFHRLTFARVEMIPGAGLVKVTGKNRSGKTSLLRSIRAALGGAGQVLPETVHAGADEADQVAAALEPWKAADRARAEAEEATKRVEAITAEMNGLDAQEKELLASAGLPVDGLSFTADGSPLLNGRPLEVASGAERIRLAVAVALAAHPALRICLVDEANDIDLDGLAELDRLAQEHGFQVWAARLGIEGPGEIVVEDGKARARDAAPETVPA